MREKLPRPLKKEKAPQVEKAESSGILESMLKKFGKVSPVLAFLVAAHALGVGHESVKKGSSKEAATLVAHLESNPDGNVQTREIPPHEIAIETNIGFQWGGRDFGRVGMEGGEREAVEAQLRAVIDQELAAYREQGVDPSKAIENIRVNIQAYSDASGALANPERNQELSQDRAGLANEVLHEILEEKGFSPQQIQIHAEGEGTEGDLLEFSGALAQLGFRTNAGSPDALRNEAQRIVDAVNQGRDSEVIRLTHGMPLEAVRQAYEQHVAAHRHANVSIHMQTVGLKIVHDAGNPPRIIEAVIPVNAKDSKTVFVERDVSLTEEQKEQWRFGQTSGQLRDPEKEPKEDEPGIYWRAPSTDRSNRLPGTESKSPVVETDEDWPEITIDTDAFDEDNLSETDQTNSETISRKNRAQRRAEASQGRKQSGNTSGSRTASLNRRGLRPGESIKNADGTSQEQPGSIRLRVSRTIEPLKTKKGRDQLIEPNGPAKTTSRPIKKPRYRAFPGGPGTFAG